MSPRGISPVAGSASSGPGSCPGSRENMGKLSTSVGRSTPRCSRFTSRILASPVTRTSTSQGKSTPWAARAVRITFRMKARILSLIPGTSAVTGM